MCLALHLTFTIWEKDKSFWKGSSEVLTRFQWDFQRMSSIDSPKLHQKIQMWQIKVIYTTLIVFKFLRGEYKLSMKINVLICISMTTIALLKSISIIGHSTGSVWHKTIFSSVFLQILLLVHKDLSIQCTSSLNSWGMKKANKLILGFQDSYWPMLTIYKYGTSMKVEILHF